MIFITLIPTRRNDGSPIPAAETDEILTRLWKTFGGATIEGPITGHWIDDTDGAHYQDECLRVSVACENDRLGEAETQVRAIGRQLGQMAMYFEIRDFDGIRFLRINSHD